MPNSLHACHVRESFYQKNLKNDSVSLKNELEMVGQWLLPMVVDTNGASKKWNREIKN